MRILLHDFGGHAFIAQLSRELARRGHELLHAFSASVQTPQGKLSRQEDDPDTLTFAPIKLAQLISKHSLFKRRRQEREHARRAVGLIEAFKPDVLICATTPSEIQYDMVRYCRRNGIKVVTWVQDLHGLAAYQILRRKIPALGAAVGRYYMWLDRQAMRMSDSVVIITDDFREHLKHMGVSQENVVCIPNWAPLAEIEVCPKDNAWSRRHELHNKTVFLYSGTLAMKHNPSLLLALAERFRDRPDVRIVVISEGASVDWLRESAQRAGLSNLATLPFQPFAELAQSLASADILLSILEPDAAKFSVPSKVLAHLCAKRPILLAAPSGNLAAKTVRQARAGLVIHPTDAEAFVATAEFLVDEPELRQRLAEQGRRCAEETFSPDKVATEFERLLGSFATGSQPLPRKDTTKAESRSAESTPPPVGDLQLDPA